MTFARCDEKPAASGCLITLEGDVVEIDWLVANVLDNYVILLFGRRLARCGVVSTRRSTAIAITFTAAADESHILCIYLDFTTLLTVLLPTA